MSTCTEDGCESSATDEVVEPPGSDPVGYCNEHSPFGKDWGRKCETCGGTPVVRKTGMCGPCTWGEADTAWGNW